MTKEPISFADVPEAMPALIVTLGVRRLRAEPAPQDRAQAGAALLGDVEAYLARFVVYPSEPARVAHALWIAHTHTMEAFDSTPRLAALSPEPASGKTRLLEVTDLLVPRPIEAINVTPAYLFRKVADKRGRPTILFDEVDTVFGPKAKGNEEVRALLNAGHRRGAVAGRCAFHGKSVVTEEIPAFCAVALAGLGDLPDTILSRSVVIRMRRRAPDETVEPFRRREHEPAGNILRSRLAEWAANILHIVTGAYPKLPLSVADRDADVWEPLLAIADAAGGTWPQRARAAAVALVAQSKESAPSLGIRLLEDLRLIFGNAGDPKAMATASILPALYALIESPWGDIRGAPLTDRRLAAMLRKYGVRPKSVRTENGTPHGYAHGDLHDAWRRYLRPGGECATSATDATKSEGAGHAP